jgi:hypothetical protein
LEPKFLAWDWDGGEYKKIPSNDVVEAIYIAWNYEFDVYMNEGEEKRLIFSGHEDNESNSEMLKPYGIRLIDHKGERKLQNIETGEIYKADWHSRN